MLAGYTARMVKDLQVPNLKGYGVCCVLPRLHVHRRQDHDFTSHQWDCKQDGGTHGYVSAEDFQV